MGVKYQYHQYIAEFLGTFFLVFFGCGSVVVSQVMPGSIVPFAIPLVFGGIVTIIIYSIGHISGAHLNPAVTLAFWATKSFPFKRIFGYLLAQFGGSMAAAATLKLILGTTGHHFGMTSMNVPLEVGFFVEVLLSFTLMFVVLGVATDTRAVGELAGIAIGLTVAICAVVGGPLTGASMNPARSFGPAFIDGNLTNLWIYFVAPVLGAVLGAFTYEWIRRFKEESATAVNV